MRVRIYIDVVVRVQLNDIALQRGQNFIRGLGVVQRTSVGALLVCGGQRFTVIDIADDVFACPRRGPRDHHGCTAENTHAWVTRHLYVGVICTRESQSLPSPLSTHHDTPARAGLGRESRVGYGGAE